MQHNGERNEHTVLPNEVYNVVAAMHEKSQALAAYDEYMNDASDDEAKQHIQHMIDLDQECLRTCEDELVRLLQKHDRWS